MFVDIQQSLEVLSVVVYRQDIKGLHFNSRLWHNLCHHISPSGWLHELPPHSSSSIIAGTSHLSWKASVLWSNLMGKTSPTSFATRCLKEWMYEDESVTAHMSCPHSFASEVFRSLLCIGIIQGSTDMHVSSWSKNSSDISIYCYPIITLQQVVVTLQYWTPFSAQTLEQRHLSTIWVAVGRWQLAKWPRYDLIWKILFLSILAAAL